MHLWTPTADDLSLLRDWLMEKPLNSPENQLARLVLELANWELDEQVREVVMKGCFKVVWGEGMKTKF